MPSSTMTASEFKREVGKAKRQARLGPVVVTSRGRATHVLLTMEEYAALTQQKPNIVDLLAMPGAEDIDFEPPRLLTGVPRPT